MVYKLDCRGCDQSYIGQTKNHLKTRLNSHQRDVRSHIEKTALSTHSLTNMHSFNFDEPTILAKTNNLNKRLFCEVAHIIKNKTVNYRADVDGLSYTYHNIIKEL